jgi:hypothetical protein
MIHVLLGFDGIFVGAIAYEAKSGVTQVIESRHS